MPIITSNPAMDADGNEFSNMLIRLSISPKVVGAANAWALTKIVVASDGSTTVTNEAAHDWTDYAGGTYT